MKTPFFTTDWAAPVRNIWPLKVFPLLPQGPLTWLELGSFEGRSALWLVEKRLYHPEDRIYCVDKWDLLFPPSPIAGYDYETVFDENVANVPQIIKRKGASHEVLPTFGLNKFHGCYIDASHEKDDVLSDARMVLPLMLHGGVIIFDDYEWPIGDGVKQAVQILFQEWKDIAKIVHVGYQVIFQLGF